MSPVPKIKAAKVAPKGRFTDRERPTRKGLLCIAFSSAGTPHPTLPRLRGRVGWGVRTDYVAEDGATQTANPCALSAGLHHKGAELHCHKRESPAHRLRRLKATVPVLRSGIR